MNDDLPIIEAGDGPNVYITRAQDGRMCAIRGLEAMEYREAIYIGEMYFGVDCPSTMGIVGAKLLSPKSPFKRAADLYEEYR